LASSTAVTQGGPSPGGQFVFGEFELDLDRGSLNRRGVEISLRPKSFSVLQYLLQHPGQLVAREELMSAVWPSAVVTDDSIAQCLIELRRALGDAERTIIRTVPRRGLIFDVPVRRADTGGRQAISQASSWVMRHGWKVGVALAAIAAALIWWAGAGSQDGITGLPPGNSIAVLPFADMSPAGDHEFFADGISEEILNHLARSTALSVIARTSSFAFKGLNEDVRDIAAKLNVAYVLEGSVRSDGENIRVTAQLVSAEDGRHLWSDTFDGTLEDIFAVQKEIAAAVADSLEVSLADSDGILDVDPRAYELFLEGRYFYHRGADGDLGRAREKFEEALSISPEFPHAWTELSATIAAVLSVDGQVGPAMSQAGRAKLMETLRHSSGQALSLAPDDPEALIRAGTYNFIAGDWDRGFELFEMARSIEPDHWLVRARLAGVLTTLGQIDEAVAINQSEIRRDPLNMKLRIPLVTYFVWAGRFKDARNESSRIYELVPSLAENSQELRVQDVRIRTLLGDHEAAETMLESMTQSVERNQLLAIHHHALGRPEQSNEELQKLTGLATNGWDAYRIAEVHAFRGERREAMEWLREINFGEDCGELALARFIYYSPFLAALDGNPDWESYRSGILELNRECLKGFEVDPV
jgi:TolB-like protein/DNA-binding winged helix-turn-helix (wHTH) protein/tetratricopeptide (TPR) repeat protein